jgi:hypothetical protein
VRLSAGLSGRRAAAPNPARRVGVIHKSTALYSYEGKT